MAHAIRRRPMPQAIPPMLGFIAGFVDICTYFGLFGIFVAQLTGSFVLASSGFVSGHQEVVTLAAIPTFFLAGVLTTAVATARAQARRPVAWALGLECALLTIMLAITQLQPLDHRDATAVVVAALVGIAAMGVQSATVRLFIQGAPSTNVMTINTTQLAIDATVAVLAIAGWADADQASASRGRLARYLPSMAAFVVGTAAGALSFEVAGIAALAAPLVLAYALLGWIIWADRTDMS